MSLDWTPPRSWMPPAHLAGHHARLEKLRPDHAEDLWSRMAGHDEIWQWLPDGPFGALSEYREHIERQAASSDPVFYAIGSADGWSGVGSLLRLDRANGVIEIGHLCFAPALQRTPAATEAVFLFAKTAFDGGFRRLEWKCNAMNAPSRRAALRYGFAFEGVFRQHMVVKGRNRDTAWFSILDREWPFLRPAFEAWLDPGNFDPHGRQRRALSDMIAQIVRNLDRGSTAEGMPKV
ncbi:GNAT family N-acetyltransferase [Jannaschia aquimarina]|uniref:N-acetyltransferase domain-containing protein n=1 Tax=Jannaschia aquimarina TaxID=935700 RepID=A0A0D1D363_9RHOB|nr:GNAT family protein [Jannaschia aquimarina]KIT14558.1 hypothetical protein jaqu_38480 [Jannaschia aquimarina]SNT35218.1 Protein N-acetyltransferase, RimJ/RimL family [Jannaschia aquimarina]